MIYLCVNWVALDFFILIFFLANLLNSHRGGQKSRKAVVSGTVWSGSTSPETSCFEMNDSAFVINISSSVVAGKRDLLRIPKTISAIYYFI